MPKPAFLRYGRWLAGLGVGLGTFAVYFANRRELGTYDTDATTLTAYSIARGHGIYLDQFASELRETDGRISVSATKVRGHLVSRYPLATAFIATPIVWLQTFYLDAHFPGWDSTPSVARVNAKTMGKHAAAALSAVANVAIYCMLIQFGLQRVALVTALAVGLGSNLWAVASQALWQHGPAVLALTGAILPLIGQGSPSRIRLFTSGIAAGMLGAIRAVDVVYALAIGGWVLVNHPRKAGWFLVGPVLIGAAVVGCNIWLFDSPLGGQSQLEALHERLHGVAGPWSGSLFGGMLGTLVSPSRGLLVYCPWIAISLGILVRNGTWPRSNGLQSWLVAGLLANLLVLSKYAVWWGGHCFGPRYWIDSTPVFAIALATSLQSATNQRSWSALAIKAAILWAVLIQAVGAFYYPSSWNHRPADVDRNHERLWDVRDNEISRCLAENAPWGRRPTN